MTDLRPPWTAEQVRTMNEFQRVGRFHPFTCANRSDGGHNRDLGDLGTLVATEDGWICPSCDYTQDWAHPFMADPEMAKPAPWPWPDPDAA